MRILSFDSATKTLAFTITNFDPELFNPSSPFMQRANDLYLLGRCIVNGVVPDITPEKIRAISDKLTGVLETLKQMIVVEYGDVTDLVPDKADEDITPIERIKALNQYIIAHPEMYRDIDLVVIEYQMSMNNKSGIISHALMAFFANYELIEIHPSNKNTIALGVGYSYADFSVKYSSSYLANKAHATACFMRLEQVIESKVPYTTKKLRGHIADAFMQSLYIARQKMNLTA
jgi:hypothetical protein